jgi:hypothetical protein
LLPIVFQVMIVLNVSMPARIPMLISSQLVLGRQDFQGSALPGGGVAGNVINTRFDRTKKPR